MVTLMAPAPVLGGCASGTSEEPAKGGWPVPAHTKLSRARYVTLVAAMDALIPGDEASPGATLAHAAYYLDQLLGAFDVDPPRIYAGGPYSGRHGGEDGFSQFQKLTRVEELRWRTYLEGSQGIPEREWNGPVTGLIEKYETWLDVLDQSARDSEGAAFATLDVGTRSKLVQKADPELVSTLYGHAVEGTYGDPVYGGNHDQLGWAAIDYEGDRQPVGYSAEQMAHPEEG
jgi:hypothetical protein